MVMTNEQQSNGANLESYGDNRYKPLEETLFFRPLSRALAQSLVNTGVHPDQISFIGFLFTVGTALVIAYGQPSWYVIVLLLIASFVLDKTDGDLARMRGIAGRKGQYVDGFLDAVGEVILITGIAIATHPSMILAMLSSAAVVIFNYHGAAVPLYLDIPPAAHVRSTQQKTTKDHVRDFFSYGRAKFFILVAVLVIIGKLPWLFYVLPILIPYTAVFFSRNIFVRKLTKR